MRDITVLSETNESWCPAKWTEQIQLHETWSNEGGNFFSAINMDGYPHPNIPGDGSGNLRP